MERNPLGQSEIQVSKIAFGLMSLSQTYGESVDEESLLSLIHI